MPDTHTLASRIDAEFSAVKEKVRNFQAQSLEEHKGREQRLAQLGKVFDDMREMLRAATGGPGQEIRGPGQDNTPDRAVNPGGDRIVDFVQT